MKELAKKSSNVHCFHVDDEKIEDRECSFGMPVYECTCGQRILIVPDVAAVDRAIKNHLLVHKKSTGKTLSEQKLTEGILQQISYKLS